MANRQSRGLVHVTSLKDRAVIAERCKVAISFGDRLRGLIGTKRFDPGQGMLFPRSKSIHMWWMSIPIDIVFLTETSEKGSWKVTSTHERVRPWKLLPISDRRGAQ